jgi:ABC-type polysaccharide/polyol phosphate transport system ATPase subunit
MFDMATLAISIRSLGKMYKLYRKPVDKVLDAFGLNRWLFWRKHYYQEFWALRDLNLDVLKGERLGIIGRNGAGKSTLLKIISGNISPTEGFVNVQGRIQALMELGTGFHPEFTGRQNIQASLAYQGISPKEGETKEAEIIDFAELENFIDQPVKTYSAGMYARLAFATATSIEPDILIIDEVLGAGDAYFAGKSLERMRRLTEESGATVLFVSHDLGSVQQMCNRVIWIDRGRVVANDDPLTVTKTYYAAILKQEEERIKSRNARLSQNEEWAAKTELNHSLLGRFVISEGIQPQQAHPIRRLTLDFGAKFKAVLEPGTPMDNDQSQAAFLLTDPIYMNWSEPQLFNNSRVRYFKDNGGQYRHAPFIFMVPNNVWEKGVGTLKVEHAARAGESVQVELYDEQGYQPLGVLEPSPDRWHTQAWPILIGETHKDKAVVEPDEAKPVGVNHNLPLLPIAAAEEALTTGDPPASNSKVILKQKVASLGNYLSDYAEFLNIETIDRVDQPKVIFALNEAIGVKVTVRVHRNIPKCGFVITIYTVNGGVMANMFWSIPTGLPPGVQSWRIIIETSNLRQSEYVISCALVEEAVARNFYTASNEIVVFYCLWDRVLSFRIEEGFMGQMPMGIVFMQTHPPIGDTLVIEDVEPVTSIRWSL